MPGKSEGEQQATGGQTAPGKSEGEQQATGAQAVPGKSPSKTQPAATGPNKPSKSNRQTENITPQEIKGREKYGSELQR